MTPPRPRITSARIRGLELLADRARVWANTRAAANSLFAPTPGDKADALLAIELIDQLVSWDAARKAPFPRGTPQPPACRPTGAEGSD